MFAPRRFAALLCAAAVLGCSPDSTAPSASPSDCVTDSECENGTPAPAVVTEVLTVAGYRTALPDARFCRYSAPIPADTTARRWTCVFTVEVSQ